MSDDRPRRSWREIDQMRDGSHRKDDRRPQGKAAEARAASATAAYLREIDKVFQSNEGGEEGARLANAIRDAHGTPALAPACREFVESLGLPRDASLLALFLDTGESELVVKALEGLLEIQKSGDLEVTEGLRSQLRVLEQDFDNAIAEAAEDLVAAF